MKPVTSIEKALYELCQKGLGSGSGGPVAVIATRWNPDKATDERFLESGDCASIREKIRSGQFPDVLFKGDEGARLVRCVEVYDFGDGDGVRVKISDGNYLINDDNTVNDWAPI